MAPSASSVTSCKDSILHREVPNACYHPPRFRGWEQLSGGCKCWSTFGYLRSHFWHFMRASEHVGREGSGGARTAVEVRVRSGLLEKHGRRVSRGAGAARRQRSSARE